MIDWDEYRYFLAVAEERSLSGAGRRLRASQPTVGRRIASLEQALEVRLFDRRPRGLVPTEAGKAILEQARRIDESVREIGLLVKGQDQRLVGSVNISAPETIGMYWLVPRLSRFRRLHPEIFLQIEFAVAAADIVGGKTDMALRFDTPGKDDVLLARKVGRAGFGLYASVDYLRENGRPLTLEQLNHHQIIATAGDLSESQLKLWLELVSGPSVVSFTSLLGCIAGVEAGLGVGVLPHYATQATGRMQRLCTGEFDKGLDLWLVVHPHTRDTARLRAVSDFIAQEIQADPITSTAQ